MNLNELKSREIDELQYYKPRSDAATQDSRGRLQALTIAIKAQQNNEDMMNALDKEFPYKSKPDFKNGYKDIIRIVKENFYD